MIIKDKTIIVTGAGSGLGKVLAIKLAQLGGKIILIARTESELKEVRELIQKEKGFAEYYICDISNFTEVQKIVKKILLTCKTIDVLINNAGIWTDDELEKSDPMRRQATLATNTLGNIQFTEEFLPYFQKRNAGHIVNVISVSGAINSPAADNSLWKTYGASKWAMTGYTKALRDALKNTKIKITAIHPGGFESMLYEKAKRINPHNQPWMMKTEDVADTIVFALTRPDDMVVESLVVTKMLQ